MHHGRWVQLSTYRLGLGAALQGFLEKHSLAAATEADEELPAVDTQGLLRGLTWLFWLQPWPSLLRPPGPCTKPARPGNLGTCRLLGMLPSVFQELFLPNPLPRDLNHINLTLSSRDKGDQPKPSLYAPVAGPGVDVHLA